jgi:hypothetical protein
MSYINRDFSPPVERQKRRETKKTLETQSTKKMGDKRDKKDTLNRHFAPFSRSSL